MRWKNKKLLVIVVSNYSPAECYHHVAGKDPELLAPLHVRFRPCRLNEHYELIDQASNELV